MKKRFKGLLTVFLIVSILFSSLGLGGISPVKAYGDSPSPLDRLVGYYQTKKSKLDNWWELVALKGAGQNLKDGSWTLPDWNSDSLPNSSNIVNYPGYILGLLARGEDPTNAWEDGRDLVGELSGKQQLDGSFGFNTNDQIWAIIALEAADSNYDHEKAVSILIGQQKENGGFAYSVSDPADPDMTGMALCALGNHLNREDVQQSIDKAVAYLESVQENNGGFSSWGSNNSNSLAAVISGLVAIGEDPLTEEWIKNGQTMLDALISFQLEDGSFSYLKDPKESNSFANQQVLIALGDLEAGQPLWGRLVNSGNPQAPTDKTVLVKMISQARTAYEGAVIGSEPGQYPAEAKTIFGQAIAVAQAVADKEIATQDEVYNTVIALKQAFADFEAQVVPYPSKTIGLRVEGINNNLLSGNFIIPSSLRPQTALDVLKEVLEVKEISYDIQDDFVRSINGETSGRFGGWDGWLYLINGESPNVGAGDYQIQEGDWIVFYYGMFPPDTLIPTVVLNPEIPKVGENFTVKVTSSYYDWNSGNNVNVEVEGATILFNGQSYLTNELGEATIPGADLPGTLRVSKESENSYPALVRTGDIPVQLMIEGTVNEDGVVSIDGEATEVIVPEGVNESKLVVTPTIEGDNSVAILPLVMVKVNNSSSLNGMMMTIPQGTKVTAPGGWGGEIILPRELNKNGITVENGDVSALVELGLSDGNLIFDKPIRLFFPNQGGKSIGYLDQQGRVKTITTGLTDDSLASAMILPPGGDGKIDVGTDLVVWTKHLTKFVIYTENTPGGGGGVPPIQEKTIRMSVMGDKDKGSILSGTIVQLQDGDTVYSVLKRTLGSRLDFVETGSTAYVRGIDGLREFDHGPLSGWVYFVNGVSPGSSASSYVLQGGERVEWRYTVDGGKDLGLPVNTVLPPVIPNQIKITKEQLVELIDQISQQVLNWGQLYDWDIFALLQAGKTVPTTYLPEVEKLLKEKKGLLNNITDYERVAITVHALGGDPTNVAGYNLIEKICNNDRMTQQGINGPVFGLLVLNSGSFSIPANVKWTQDKLVKWILEQQSSTGGFPLYPGGEDSVDMTAMALTALSDYQDQKEVKGAIEKGVGWLSKIQSKKGGYNSLGEESSETVSQVIIALTSLWIDPRGVQFAKEEGDLITNLLSFKKEDGGFSHFLDQSSDQIATQQGLMALVAYHRFLEGREKLYFVREHSKLPMEEMQFIDANNISPWANQFVQRAFQSKLMQGVSQTELRFAPQEKMTRAQFATLVLKMMGEEPNLQSKQTFDDVRPGSWYYGSVMRMKEKGIIQGIDSSTFCPDRPITRQEMAIMITRAFNLVALGTRVDLKDLDLAYPQALPSIRTVYTNGLMVGDNGYFRPTDQVTREMAAVISVKIYEAMIKG